MRIVGSESHPLPPLDPLPLPSLDSWALQVEREEAAHLHTKHNPLHTDPIRLCSDNGKERSWGSSKWADSASRKASHLGRDAEIKTKFKMGRSPDRASRNTLGTRIQYGFESCHDSQRQARSIKTSTRRYTHSPAQGNYYSNGSSRSEGLCEPGRVNEKKISPPRSHGSHHGRSRAVFNESAMYPDTVVSETANRSCHTSSRSDNAHSQQSHRARHGGMQAGRFSDDTDHARHRRIQTCENKDVRDGYCKRSQDVRLAESAYSARCNKLSQLSDNKKHDYLKWHNRSSGHEAFRKSEGNVYDVENGSRQGIDGLELESRSHSDYDKKSKDKGRIPAADMQSEGNGELAIDAEPETSGRSISPTKLKTLLMQQSFDERTGEEESDTTTLQAEGMSYRLLGLTDNVYKNSNGSDIMLEMSTKSGAEAEEGDLSDTEKQYKMLASLLLDDSLDIDQDFDVTIVPGGPEVVYCGSIFDDDFMLPASMDVEAAACVNNAVSTKKEEAVNASQLDELQESHHCVMRGLLEAASTTKEEALPIAPGGPDPKYHESTFLPDSMDVEAAACVNDAVSTKKEEAVHTSQLDELQEPHLCLMRGLFQDGEIIPKCQSVSSNKLVKKHAFTSPGFQSVGKHKFLQDSLKIKPSPRVLVDVTNKFEIQAAPVKRETQENDCHRLSQRQRQVEFGKNTLGYERYSELIPRCKRKPQDPQTPNPKQICSKRSWDGQIRKWRRLLHAYDLPTEDGEERAEDFSIYKSSQCDVADPLQVNNTRFSKSTGNKVCNASEVKIDDDINLSIYEDWIVS